MFSPQDRGEAFRQELGLGGQFVVTYAGALGMANDIGVLIDAAAQLRGNDGIRILIVGDGKERKRHEDRARELGLTNVIFTGAMPKSRMNTVLAASDACVATSAPLRFARQFPVRFARRQRGQLR